MTAPTWYPGTDWRARVPQRPVLLDPPERPVRDKARKRQQLAERALAGIETFAASFEGLVPA